MNYLHPQFTQHVSNIKTIFEVGSRDCLDTIAMRNFFPSSKLYAYECNPHAINICNSNLKNNDKNIFFHEFALGEKTDKRSFFPYNPTENCGASSFYKRIDFSYTQTEIKDVKISTIEEEVSRYNIDSIDLLCMDVQGYELNVLIGARLFLKNISFIILECPLKEPNQDFLPKGVHSKYLNAPTYEDIFSFLNTNNFELIEEVFENHLESNLMFRNMYHDDKSITI